jgi:hypothetical protein
VLGQILTGMSPQDPPVEDERNAPMMPVAWTKSHVSGSGQIARTFTTTMGASQDLESAGLRRMIVNACYWGLRMEDQIVADSCVDLVGEYRPTKFSFGGYTPGVRPADHAWSE